MPSITAYFGKYGEIRVYSGSDDGSGGKYYFQVAFAGMDFQTVLGRPRPDEIPVMDRGILNGYAHHIQGPDVPIIQPQQLTWTCMIDNTINRRNLRRCLSNPDRESPWQVGGVTWSNVNGTTMQINGAGSLVSTPMPYDTQHDRVNISVLWKGDPLDATETDNMGFNLNEVWFQPGQTRIVEAPDSVKLNVTGWIYGAISAMSAFNQGTDISR